MVRQQATVNLKTGLQARPAAFFVQEANRYSAEIFVEKDNKKVNAKSIMGIMSLAVSNGTEITISAEGSDAEEAVSNLKVLVEKAEA
ncbi:HPr family phosphocarrier protein [Ammoniphilus sp. CFH 90114]|uniref:HPr family phosphocarrier protein n=1 Tax=Ammoniphilus sp. CFH 90114 TaxID=2493665 RepID=UPI00100ED1AF|nr:HPr family phosphocarrier protein [Ammoniphilus sp. CFH 90114]RXT04038.1 HPr family phosphocarrier protein [Ammoniphilus sp. CFH 90114]